MTTPAHLLGSAASDLERARRAQRFATSLNALLDERIQELAAADDDFLEGRIRELRTAIAESETEYRQAAAEVDRLEQAVRQLSRGIVSLWRRLGTLLRKCLRPKSPGTAALRERFSQLEDQLQQAEERRDYRAQLLRRQQRDLRRAEAVTERVAAIRETLQRQARLASRRSLAGRQAMDAVVRQAARRVLPAMLLIRHELQPPTSESDAMFVDLVELRNLLLRHAVLSAQLAVSRDPRSHAITLRALDETVSGGFSRTEGSGKGTVHLSGQGEHHVKRSRTRSETYRDAHGRTRTRNKRETYWERRPVTFAGELPVRFPVSSQHWNSDGLAETIWDEAGDWLEQGYREARAKTATDDLKRLDSQANTLIERILGRMEPASKTLEEEVPWTYGSR